MRMVMPALLAAWMPQPHECAEVVLGPMDEVCDRDQRAPLVAGRNHRVVFLADYEIDPPLEFVHLGIDAGVERDILKGALDEFDPLVRNPQAEGGLKNPFEHALFVGPNLQFIQNMVQANRNSACPLELALVEGDAGYNLQSLPALCGNQRGWKT